jgi:hypothetical protein
MVTMIGATFDTWLNYRHRIGILQHLIRITLIERSFKAKRGYMIKYTWNGLSKPHCA